MKKKISLILIITLAILFATAFCAVQYELQEHLYESELTIDYSSPQDKITHGATGFLYGLAEPNVPNGNMLYALEPKVLSTKVPNGLQHPSGDLQKVNDYFFENGGKNIIIYMQDIYPDWYYSYRDDYLETMSSVLDTTIPLSNSDKFIYQPFNEMNNGVWYGDFNVYNNRLKFYNAFRDAYKLIKEKTNGAPVGGPAYTDYNSKYIKEFLEYCIANQCIPDVMIWHELFWYSTYGIRDTVKDYRNIEKELGIDELRIIIDEYGTFKDVGTPGNLMQYIASFEETNTEGCLAFWRLPNNMNDLVTNNNMPTSTWWLYEWYAEMQGLTYKVTKSEKTIPYFSAITTIDEEKATIICGGGQGNSRINLEGLSTLDLFKNAPSIKYYVEYLDFEGLTAPSLGGKPIIWGENIITDGRSTIKLDEITSSRAYKIKIYPSNNDINSNTHELIPTPSRYEAENGEIIRSETRKNEDIRYASSGGGVELNRGGSVTFNIRVPNDGYYSLEFGYISNPTIGNIRLNPRVKIYIDGKMEIHTLPNTLTEHSSTHYVTYSELKKGKHIIAVRYDYGDVTLDFLDVEYLSSSSLSYHPTYTSQPLKSKYNEHILVVPKSGYYTNISNQKLISVNNIDINPQATQIFLEYGVNILKFSESFQSFKTEKINVDEYTVYSIEEAQGASPFLVKNDNSPTGFYAKDVPENYELAFRIFIENSGNYAINTTYSQSKTYGDHPYNVKLVEQYATIKINDTIFDTVYFANTYSDFNFNENTIYLHLNKGYNTITFVNMGDYVWNDLKNTLPNIAQIEVYELSK